MTATVRSFLNEAATADRVAAWRRPCGRLEVLSTVTVLAVVIGVILPWLAVPVYHAKFSEAMVAAAGGKMRVIEAMAFDSVQWSPASGSGAVLQLTAEAYLSGQTAVATAQKGIVESAFKQVVDKTKGIKPTDKSSDDRRLVRGSGDEQGTGDGAISQRIKFVDQLQLDRTGVTVSGRISGPGDEAYELTLTVATRDRAAPAVAIWLCGDAAVPDGWVAERHVPARLPPRHLRPSVCNAKAAAR